MSRSRVMIFAVACCYAVGVMVGYVLIPGGRDGASAVEASERARLSAPSGGGGPTRLREPRVRDASFDPSTPIGVDEFGNIRVPPSRFSYLAYPSVSLTDGAYFREPLEELGLDAGQIEGFQSLVADLFRERCERERASMRKLKSEDGTTLIEISRNSQGSAALQASALDRLHQLLKSDQKFADMLLGMSLEDATGHWEADARYLDVRIDPADGRYKAQMFGVPAENLPGLDPEITVSGLRGVAKSLGTSWWEPGEKVPAHFSHLLEGSGVSK